MIENVAVSGCGNTVFADLQPVAINRSATCPGFKINTLAGQCRPKRFRWVFGKTVFPETYAKKPSLQLQQDPS
jgi:hypothetical protein